MMKKFCKPLLILLTAFAMNALAEKTTVAKKPVPAKLRNYFQISLGYQQLQEGIKATKGSDKATIRTSMRGFNLAGQYNIPFRQSSWRHFYGLIASWGETKGQGDAVITDPVKDQPWTMFTFNPGVMYRTAPHTEVGISLPLSYRTIDWQFDNGLSMERKASFTPGLSGIFVVRVSAASAFHVSLTHQHVWQNTMWAIGWTYTVR